MEKIKRALLSVSDKTGLVEFAKKLTRYKIELISTGGTANLLREAGLTVRDVSEVTGFPEIMDGRVKTLHPKIHGGLLGRRDVPAHLEAMRELEIEPIDLVVVNLYPFESTVAREGVLLEEAIENIDIGGPSMLRSAAKNWASVTVVVDPADYETLGFEMEANRGAVSRDTRFDLARKVFAHTARYDGAIAGYLTTLASSESAERSAFPGTLTVQMRKMEDLRYGENPHQKAAFYGELEVKEPCIANARQLQGKDLSFNNILDLDAALEIIKGFEVTASVVIKHTNPCGAALSAYSLVDAYTKAREVDPTSAFGGIVGFNREVDADTAKELIATFLEAIVAPAFSAEARQILSAKQNLRLLETGPLQPSGPALDYKRVGGGLLVQERDVARVRREELKVVTAREPSQDELDAMLFGWAICKHVKSNAIVYARPGQLVAVGAGQMSRVDSSRIAVQKAVLPLQGSAVASDAFFPFADGVEAAAAAGATAIIQPGGSIRDDEVIAAANAHNMAMVFTGVRHFKH
jgi:phosphoribosylaminoimidazolecarboxamide formyltransferase / IMP cyclohydrolase